MLPLMSRLPATMSHPLQVPLPWIVSEGMLAAGVEFVSTLPSVVSTKMMPFFGGTPPFQEGTPLEYVPCAFAIAFSVAMSVFDKSMPLGKVALFSWPTPPGGAERLGVPLVTTVPVLATAATGVTPEQYAPAATFP